MGCNCNTNINTNTDNKNKLNLISTLINFILFLLLMVLTTPFIIIMVNYILFKSIVLKSDGIDLHNMLKYVVNKLKIKNTSDNDNSDVNEDDYELTNVNEVNNE